MLSGSVYVVFYRPKKRISNSVSGCFQRCLPIRDNAAGTRPRQRQDRRLDAGGPACTCHPGRGFLSLVLLGVCGCCLRVQWHGCRSRLVGKRIDIWGGDGVMALPRCNPRTINAEPRSVDRSSVCGVGSELHVHHHIEFRKFPSSPKETPYPSGSLPIVPQVPRPRQLPPPPFSNPLASPRGAGTCVSKREALEHSPRDVIPVTSSGHKCSCERLSGFVYCDCFLTHSPRRSTHAVGETSLQDLSGVKPGPPLNLATYPASSCISLHN